jgi:YHS domain-containing protein
VVDPAKAPAKYCHNGVEIYFCAQGCKAAFEANPNKYTAKKKKGGYIQHHKKFPCIAFGQG